MLMRILTMRIAEGCLEDWKRYTKGIGFPGMLSQPGCSKINRMHRVGAPADEYEVVTWWDSIEHLDRFKASSAIRELSAKAAGLKIPPHREALYQVDRE